MHPTANLIGAGDKLTVVIIGLNTAATLEMCIGSVHKACQPLGPVRVIYVDGGSKDESIEIAKRMGVEVIQLTTTEPTAGKGRNAGWMAATTPFVQFVDSDTFLDSNWLLRGIETIQAEPKIACVFGRLNEMDPTGSIYNRLCGFDWYIPTGDWRMCGGNALFRIEALREVNGFDPTLRAGEEPDLCWRLRQKGYRIVCIDVPMAHHNLRMTGFSMYWRRAVRSGYAYAEIGLRFARTNDRLWLREFIVNLLTLPVGLSAVTVIFLLGGLQAVVIFAAVMALPFFWKFHSLRERIRSSTFRLLYVLHIGFLKIPLFFGSIKYFMKRSAR